MTYPQIWFSKRKLLNQGFLLLKLKSPLRKFCGLHHDLIDRYGISMSTNEHGYIPFVVNTSLSFPRSWFITGFATRLTREMPLVEQELLTLPEHLSSPPVFSGDRATRSLAWYVWFVDRCLSFVLFLLPIVFSVHLRYTDSDYPFGIFKLFFH